MTKLRRIFSLLAPLLLLGCGGGNDTPAATPNVQASNLFYGVNATFFMGVTSLNPGVTLSADKCSNLVPASSSTTTNSLSYTCKVTGTGKLTLTASDGSGASLVTKTFTVPEPRVQLDTSMGTVVFELDPTRAPVSVDNFLKYVNSGYYTDTIFHRVIPNFVVQAGGFRSGLVPIMQSFLPITLESNNGLSNLAGTLAMARTSDPNSATSQFYVNLVDNTSLDYVDSSKPGYAVFGKVVSGIEVVNAIGQVKTGPSVDTSGVPLSDVPTAEVSIVSMKRIQ